MKRVVRIQGQGKVKEVGLRELSAVPAAESVDAKVALIQELIPLGLEAVAEALEAEVIALAGECGTVARAGARGRSGGVTSAGRSTSRTRSSRSPTSGCATGLATRRSPCPPTSDCRPRGRPMRGSSGRSCTA